MAEGKLAHGLSLPSSDRDRAFFAGTLQVSEGAVRNHNDHPIIHRALVSRYADGYVPSTAENWSKP